MGRNGEVRLLFPRILLALGGLGAFASTGCVYARILYFNIPTLEAPRSFDDRLVRAPALSVPLPRERPDPVFLRPPSDHGRYRSFDDFLEKNDTRAFLVVRDDKVVYERYFDGASAATLFPDFSVSKTITALLVGCAIADGLVESVDRPIAEYVPDLRGRPRYDRITVEQLLRMTPGLDFREDSVSGAVLYYTTDFPSLLYSYEAKWPPGTHYLYGSLSTAILWDVLHRRLAGRTVSDYFAARVWAPLGAEAPATWSLDSASSGAEKLFGGFNATARDHARLGLLYLHGGEISGKRIVPEQWVRDSLEPDPTAGRVHTTDGWVRRGKYEWFLTMDGRAYFAKGYHGQYVFVVPDRRTVFVRFGEGYGDVDWAALFLRLADSLSQAP